VPIVAALLGLTIMESGTGKKREVALGLDPYYKRLAEQTQSVQWKEWAKYGSKRSRGV
jgi:hypothetical protein